jgi:hypothetical protein
MSHPARSRGCRLIDQCWMRGGIEDSFGQLRPSPWPQGALPRPPWGETSELVFTTCYISPLTQGQRANNLDVTYIYFVLQKYNTLKRKTRNSVQQKTLKVFKVFKALYDMTRLFPVLLEDSPWEGRSLLQLLAPKGDKPHSVADAGTFEPVPSNLSQM